MTDYTTAIPVGDDLLWWNPAPQGRRRNVACEYIAGEPLTAVALNCSRGDYRTLPVVDCYPTTAGGLFRGTCPWCGTPHSFLHREVEEWCCFTIWGTYDWRMPGGWCPEYPNRMINVYIWGGTAATVRLAA